MCAPVQGPHKGVSLEDVKSEKESVASTEIHKLLDEHRAHLEDDVATATERENAYEDSDWITASESEKSESSKGKGPSKPREPKGKEHAKDSRPTTPQWGEITLSEEEIDPEAQRRMFAQWNELRRQQKSAAKRAREAQKAGKADPRNKDLPIRTPR
ncbi:hypothetical protein HGRIS_009057 [Hohenbuehelia grisea]|uniref:Uncharacterized protein n=1 Tax=Hohenbuehelia grisea TaxID=104357 RepID=A0ABR3J001_9AGAR